MAALLVVTAGCAVTDTTLAQDDPGPLHVHALAVDPEDDQALLAAAHTGLFRLDGDGAERVSGYWHDLMAFAVTADGALLASGHPALDADGRRRSVEVLEVDGPATPSAMLSRTVAPSLQRLPAKGRSQ